MTRLLTGSVKPVRESESDFCYWLYDALLLHRWRFCHFRPARTSKGWVTAISGSPGWPDIMAVRGKRVLFIEAKSEKGRLTQDQAQWGEALIAAGVEYYLCRPSDRAEIMKVLQ